MTTLNPATRLSSPELAVTRAGPQIRVRLPVGGRRWWALAIGHVPAGQGQPSVTFTRELPGACGAAVRPDAVDGLWVTVDGLWVAVAERYTAVRCAAGPVTLTRRLRPVTARPAP